MTQFWKVRLGKAVVLLFALFYMAISVAAYYPPVRASQGMVISDHYLASIVGANVLKQGGNAMDAAVAVGYALAVVHPCCGNIGGGGFMLVHWHDGQNIALDFREAAPKNIAVKLFFNDKQRLKSKSELGYLFVGVPGTVMGLNEALKKFGTWPLAKVMAPAIRLAKQGFVLNHYDVKNMERAQKQLVSQDNLKTLFMPNGRFLQPGQRFVQKNLANTLEKISQQGATAFYQGDIAAAIVEASTANHGVLALEDFKNYHIIWRQPLRCNYRDYQLLSMPPPGSGVTICEILKIVDYFPLGKLGFHSSASVRINAAAMKQAFYDRNHYLGDPDFVSNPTNWLLSDKRIHKIQRFIAKGGRITPHLFKKAEKHMYTTHFAVMDRQANVVATTYTINSFFGSHRMAGSTGFFLNNELWDFALRKNQPNIFWLIHGAANLIASGKRPLSSMSPTIVMKNNKVYMALGAAGGPTIITTIVQAIENVVDYGMNIRASNDSPRYHMQGFPDIIYWEPFGFSRDTVDALRQMGYVVQHKLFGQYLYWGQLNSMLINQGIITGASDNRQPNGRAIGIKKAQPSKAKSNTFAGKGKGEHYVL